MTATADAEFEAGSSDGDAVLGYLSRVLAAVGGLATAESCRGVCARHKHPRELPGWTIKTHRLTRSGQPHLIATSIPSGHTYLGRAPDPP